MPIVPLRDLGSVGVVTDVDPFDLPIHAFSFAKNVRFQDNKVERGSVFRKVGNVETLMRHLTMYEDSQGEPHTILVNTLGGVFEWNSLAGLVNLTPAGHTYIADDNSFVTSCYLQGVLYVNRSDRIPWYRPLASLTGFQALPTNNSTGVLSGSGQWHTDWHCRSLTAMNGVLIALNVTKGAQRNPNMVKWSNFAYNQGQPPADWDYADPASNAGENTLSEMEGEIVAGHKLKNRMFIYGDREVWSMDYTGGSSMWSFNRAFDRNVINAGCVAEVNGIHYVFGVDDIWMHDGVQDKSLAAGKVRTFIYRSMRKNKKHLNFVTHNRRTNEVIFCYVSDDPYCKYQADDGDGCNRAMIYNYASQTFTFADMPYVTCATISRPREFGAPFEAQTTPAPKAGFAGTFETVGGSFAALTVETKENLTFGCTPGPTTTAALRTFEPFHESAASFVLDIPANGEAYLERKGIDLDEVQAELRGYKLISSIYPQGRLDTDARPIVFEVGVQDHVEEALEFGDEQTWDRNFYKLDFNQAGRYLGYRIRHDDFKPFQFSGFDFDIQVLGRF